MRSEENQFYDREFRDLFAPDNVEEQTSLKQKIQDLKHKNEQLEKEKKDLLLTQSNLNAQIEGF